MSALGPESSLGEFHAKALAEPYVNVSGPVRNFVFVSHTMHERRSRDGEQRTEDRYRVLDAPMRGRLLRVTTPAAHRPRAPQVLQQLFLQGTAGLNEEASVDRLVRHLVVLVIWIRVLEPASDLLRGPQTVELTRYDTGQRPVLHQFTGIRTARPVPGRLVSLVGSIASAAVITPDLTTHR